MDKKIKAIYSVARKNGWSVRHMYTDEQRDEITGVQLDNVCLAFHSESPRGVGFNFQVTVPNCGDVENFRDNVSMAIYDFWKNFDDNLETEKYINKIGCQDTRQRREIYEDIAACEYMIYNLFFNI